MNVSPSEINYKQPSLSLSFTHIRTGGKRVENQNLTKGSTYWRTDGHNIYRGRFNRLIYFDSYVCRVVVVRKIPWSKFFFIIEGFLLWYGRNCIIGRLLELSWFMSWNGNYGVATKIPEILKQFFFVISYEPSVIVCRLVGLWVCHKLLKGREATLPCTCWFCCDACLAFYIFWVICIQYICLEQ